MRAALNVSYVAAVWSLLTGTAAAIIGVKAGSTSLVGTGTDVLADMASSIVLVWRFHAELHGGRPSHIVEKRAHLVASLALLIVAVGVAVGSIIRLVTGHGASPMMAGIIVAAVSVVTLPVLAVAKLRIAAAANSRALRTDALISLVGAATAALSLVGLGVTGLLHWTAADPIAALLIAVLAGTTGIRELRQRSS
ncbi:MAG: cation transporter [Propionibacteriaceae bacterium]|nr:cation transporter [Propionibacteriaceae bacterium]